MSEEIKEQMEWLQAVTEYWQKALRLQDWHVEVRICSTRDLEKLREGQRPAFNTIYPALHESIIRIKDLNERYNEDDLAEDIEIDLVHELLHLHFDGLYCDDKRESAAEVIHERALNAVAEALVNFRRMLHAGEESENVERCEGHICAGCNTVTVEEGANSAGWK